MSVDHSKTAVIWLWHRDSGARANFDLLVYGVTAEDLQTVPNEIVGMIADRYPDYVGSPFGVQTLRGKVGGKKPIPKLPPVDERATTRAGRAELRRSHPHIREGLPVKGIREDDGTVRMRD